MRSRNWAFRMRRAAAPRLPGPRRSVATRSAHQRIAERGGESCSGAAYPNVGGDPHDGEPVQIKARLGSARYPSAWAEEGGGEHSGLSVVEVCCAARAQLPDVNRTRSRKVVG